MLMMIKNFFLLFFFFSFFLLLLVPPSVYSQESDFGIWYEVNAEKSFSKKFDINGSAMIRTFENASTIEQAYLELGATYNLNKYVGFAGAYRIGNYLEDDDLYHIRNKWFADIKGSYPVKNLLFSVRFRLQIQKKTYIEDESDKIPEYVGRIRLKGIYKIPKFPVNPYASVETFNPLFENSGVLFVKNRYTLGFEYKINKKNFIESEYIFQQVYYPHHTNFHIFSLSYTFKFLENKKSKAN
jgi:hypothetical protein